MATLLPLSKSTIRISLLLIFLSITASSISPAKIPYHQHCNSIVLESISKSIELNPLNFLNLQGGYFKGAQKILTPQTPFLYFITKSLFQTETEGILKIQATLTFQTSQTYEILQNYSTFLSPDHQTIYYNAGEINFQLQGFWSESTGKLCMVGSAFGRSKEGDSLQLSAVFKLNYPKTSNISTSIVTGTVESVDDAGDSNYFDPISVLGFAQKTYKYMLVSEIRRKSDGGDTNNEKSLGYDSGSGACYTLSPFTGRDFQLEYVSGCAAGNCSIFDGFLPNLMTVGGIQCSDEGRMRLYLRFSNSTFTRSNVPLIPETSLVAEGFWDGEKNQFCLVGCRLRNFKGSLAETGVGNCSVGLRLRFPKIFSLKMRSNVVGSIWSRKKPNESGYFNRIGFRSSDDGTVTTSVSGMKYDYTELGRVRKLCEKKGNENKITHKRFPNSQSFEDMRFDMSLKGSRNGKFGWGSGTPLSIGEVFYDRLSYSIEPISFAPISSLEPSVTVVRPTMSNQSQLNVSYSIEIRFWDRNTNVSEPIKISAEGIYDAETGFLCMVGCGSSAKNKTMDCEILINVNFAPYNSKTREYLKGTVRSMRAKRDPIYFEQIEFSSHVMYAEEAKETIWRIDVEITMVLISLTLACVLIGLQLFYVKKYPYVLPSVSVMMLVVLTLGHMIPLVLNFEALFFRHRNRQNVLIWSGGWLEVNEVIVRVITMVAFLLQFRLLQLTFSARLAEGSKNGLWVAEKKAVGLIVLLYVVGGSIASFVHWKKFQGTPEPTEGLAVANSQQHSSWEDMRSFAGLVLDGFLLPQILLNLFWDSKDKALTPFFYVGTTIVRLLPHAYDAYRAHKSLPYVNTSYIYADPGWDLYSATWDVVIPCGGLIFAVLIYLQQRFGGAFILPQKFRQSAEYEKVPVVSV